MPEKKKVHIDEQIQQAKALVNNSWKQLNEEDREVALAIVTTLDWVSKNASTIRLAAEVGRHPDLLGFVQDALEAQKAFPGSEFHLPTENEV